MKKHILATLGVFGLVAILGFGTLQANGYVRSFRVHNNAGTQSECRRLYNENNAYYTGVNARYTYTNCLEQKAQPFRPYGYRRAPYSLYRSSYFEQKKLPTQSYRRGVSVQSLYSRPMVPKNVISNQDRALLIELQDARTPAVTARKENLRSTDRIVVRNGDVKYTNRHTDPNYQNQRMRVNLTRNNVSTKAPLSYKITQPSGFDLARDGYYRSDKTSVAFRVVPSTNTCSKISFGTCVSADQNTFARLNDLQKRTIMYRKVGTSDTVLGKRTPYPVFIESFTAKEMAHVHFAALDPQTGNIVRIEAKGNKKDMETASFLVYKMAEGFRFSPRQ